MDQEVIVGPQNLAEVMRRFGMRPNDSKDAVGDRVFKKQNRILHTARLQWSGQPSCDASILGMDLRQFHPRPPEQFHRLDLSGLHDVKYSVAHLAKVAKDVTSHLGS